jgi:DNA-binding NarL/FixJ family response regulator
MPNTADLITVVAVADSTVLRAGLRALLAADGDIAVVAEAESVAAALGDITALQPDVVVVDVRNPYRFDAHLRREVEMRGQHRPVLLLSPRIDDDAILELVASGASGYLCEDVAPDFLRDAVRSLYEGGAPLCPQIAEAISARLLSRLEVPGGDGPQLAPEELNLLQHVVQGRTDREIGSHLHLEEHVVKHRMTTIVKKLHVRNRTAAAAWCARQEQLGAGGVRDVRSAEPVDR